MSADGSGQPVERPTARTHAVAALSFVVAVVLGDSGVVTLALPEILRDFGAEVGDVAWVLIAFNLVLALVAVPAARVCVRVDPAAATAGGLILFAAATGVCAIAPSLGVLIAARAAQAAGGALVIVGSLELLVDVDRSRARRSATVGRGRRRGSRARPGHRGPADLGVLVAVDLRGADPDRSSWRCPP